MVLNEPVDLRVHVYYLTTRVPADADAALRTGLFAAQFMHDVWNCDGPTYEFHPWEVRAAALTTRVLVYSLT